MVQLAMTGRQAIEKIQALTGCIVYNLLPADEAGFVYLYTTNDYETFRLIDLKP
ncbi:hypothetical protein FAES_3264 [Fibrella aestuarina BUZ 2]|uniref:Uncharacterized protein n=1 Tax=Fibrella aestuarina BUZ 2 TaxID=1166018 RepID=I0KAX0_9BACT|nr:hypothetical protein FAES_3264 [Fibrella aestuarina BUZ 2]